MTKDWRDILKIQEITENCLVNGNGDITIGFNVVLPPAYSLTWPIKNDIYSGFSVFLRSLNEGVRLHKQDFFFSSHFEMDKNASDTISLYKNKLHFEEKIVPQTSSFLYITFPNKILAKSQADFIFKRPFKNVKAYIDKTRNDIVQVENSLVSINHIEFKRLDNEALLHNLKDYLNLSYGRSNSNIDYLNSIQVEDNYIKNGSEFLKVISLIDEGDTLIDFKTPKVVSGDVFDEGIDLDAKITKDCSFLFPVSVGLPFKHILNTVLVIENEEKVKSKLKTANILSNPIKGIVPAALSKQTMTTMYMEHLEKNNVKAINIGMNVILHDESIAKIEAREGFVRSAFGSMNNAKVLIENFNTLNAFSYSSPGNTRSFAHLFLSDNERASKYLNIEGYSVADDKGFLCLTRMGAPVKVNLHNTKLVEAFHSLILAPTGTGKSYFIHNDIDNALSSDKEIVLINTKDDYYKYYLFLKESGYNVSYVDTNKDKIGIDLFDVEKDSSGIYMVDEFHLLMMKSILSVAWRNNKDIKEVEDAILSEIILAYFKSASETKEQATFEGFISFIPVFNNRIKGNEKYQDPTGNPFFDFNEFLLIIRNYTNVFNQDNTVSIKKDKVSFFDLGGVMGDKKIFKIYIIYTFGKALAKVKYNGKRNIHTKVIMDECIDSMQGKGAEIVGEAFRKFRSKNASICLATQGITYFNDLSETVRDSIFNNAFTKILLDHSQNRKDFEVLKKKLDLGDQGIDMLDSISTDIDKPYREFFLDLGGRQRVYRNEVSPFTNLLFSTRPADISKIMGYYNENNSIRKSIELCLAEN